MFNFLNPIHWFQFADDAAVITGQDYENQHLLNLLKMLDARPGFIIKFLKRSLIVNLFKTQAFTRVYVGGTTHCYIAFHYNCNCNCKPLSL
jgi:hypothetical protein